MSCWTATSGSCTMSCTGAEQGERSIFTGCGGLPIDLVRGSVGLTCPRARGPCEESRHCTADGAPGLARARARHVHARVRGGTGADLVAHVRRLEPQFVADDRRRQRRRPQRHRPSATKTATSACSTPRRAQPSGLAADEPCAARTPTAIDGSPAVARPRQGRRQRDRCAGAVRRGRRNKRAASSCSARDGSIRCRVPDRRRGQRVGEHRRPRRLSRRRVLVARDRRRRRRRRIPTSCSAAWDLRVHAIDRNCNEISGFP